MHAAAVHGGVQAYRNRLFSLAGIAPRRVTGQEWRLIVANFSEFQVRGAMDWQRFSKPMLAALPEGLPRELRWDPRQLVACVFCATVGWGETRRFLYLAGPLCSLKDPTAVARLLAVERYGSRWPNIPIEELDASSVEIVLGQPSPGSGRPRHPGAGPWMAEQGNIECVAKDLEYAFQVDPFLLPNRAA